MAEETKSTPSTGTSSNASTSKGSKEMLAGSPSGASVYTPEQIKAFQEQQKRQEERTAAIEKGSFELKDEELPQNKQVKLGSVPVTDSFNDAVESSHVEETSAAKKQPTPSTIVLDPSKFGIVTKTPGMDETVPGGLYVKVRGNIAYYVNANDEEVDENGKLLYPRQEVNVLNMAQPNFR